MDDNGIASAEPQERLRRLAGLLVEFARIMAEQAEFHSGVRMDVGVSVVRDAAAQATRRIARIDVAGRRWLREMEKTMLSEIARAAHWAAAVLGEAGAEAWPDLESAAAQARTVIREAAARDPGLFTPSGFSPDAVANAEAAPFSLPDDWRAVDGGCFVAVGTGGIPMAAVAWEQPSGRSWLAQVGGIGLAFHGTAEDAARHAAAAYSDWFGAAVI